MTKQEKLDRAKKRLELYYAKEEEMLTGAQTIGLGTRSRSKYMLDLANLREQIAELEEEVETLENGTKPRKSVHVVPTDW